MKMKYLTCLAAIGAIILSSCKKYVLDGGKEPDLPRIEEVGDLGVELYTATQSGITISWKDLRGVASVRLACGEKGTSPKVFEDGFKGAEYTFSGLVPGKDYTVELTPLDDKGKAGKVYALTASTRSTMSISAALGLYQIDAMTKVSERGILQKFDCDTLDMARGEISSIQVGFEALEDLVGISVVVDNFTDGKGNVLPAPSVGWVEYVASSVNPVSYGYLNDRTFADPIIPSSEPFSLTKGSHKLLWLDIEAPAGTAPGLYTSKICVGGSSASGRIDQELYVSCRVYPVDIRPSGLKVTNWIFEWFFEQMNNGVKPEYGDPVYFEMRDLLANICKSIGQNTYLLAPQPYPSGISSDNTFLFDFKRFDEEVEFYMANGGMKFIEGSHICHVVSAWGSNYAPVYCYKPNGAGGWIKFTDEDMDARYEENKEYIENYFRDYFTALSAHLKEKGWTDIFALHIGDEPAASNYDTWRRYALLSKKYAPEIKLMDAVDNGSTRYIGDLCDIMVPKIDVLDEEYDYYMQRQAEGRKDWFYTCVLPQGEYPNRFLCQPLLKTRYLHWENYRTGTEGFLHWGLMYWGDDLYKDIFQDAAVSGLPGGDSYLIYPGYRTLYSSTRACAQREGINDYALLKMVELVNKMQADDWVSQVAPDFRNFNLSTSDFRRIRREMLEYLSK